MNLRLLCALCLCSFAWGCGSPESPSSDGAQQPAPQQASDAAHADPHDVPLTDEEIATLQTETAQWSTAISRLEEYRDTIRTETTSGAPAKAHRALDLADYVLQWLPEIAQQSDLPREDWRTVGENAQAIRDAFNSIHENIDAGEDPNYEQYAEQIDASLNALKAVSPDGAGGEA